MICLIGPFGLGLVGLVFCGLHPCAFQMRGGSAGGGELMERLMVAFKYISAELDPFTAQVCVHLLFAVTASTILSANL